MVENIGDLGFRRQMVQILRNIATFTREIVEGNLGKVTKIRKNKKQTLFQIVILII